MISLAGHGVPRLALWPRGVDQTRFTPQRRISERVQQRRRELAPDGEVLVGYIGRLAPEKRVERLEVLADVPGIRLVLGGDGPARRGLQRTLRQLDPVFLGWLDGDDLADAYALLDIFVHTGTAETFGQTIQEAMATGVPVIAPACGGPLDLIRPGVTGLHYPPDDDKALRDAITALSHNQAWRRSLGEAGHASVQDRTWQALGDQLITHYRSVIAAFARQAPAAGSASAGSGVPHGAGTEAASYPAIGRDAARAEPTAMLAHPHGASSSIVSDRTLVRARHLRWMSADAAVFATVAAVAP